MIFLFVLLAFTVGRVTRFITHDDLIIEPRQAILSWLYEHDVDLDDPKWEAPLWRRKLATLIDCVYCASIWVSGFTILVLIFLVDYDLPLPLFWWPALSLAAVNILQFTDGDWIVKLSQSPKK